MNDCPKMVSCNLYVGVTHWLLGDDSDVLVANLQRSYY